jgi:hypothetical protein
MGMPHANGLGGNDETFAAIVSAFERVGMPRYLGSPLPGRRHCVPVKLSGGGRSLQFGRTSAAPRSPAKAARGGIKTKAI